MVNLKKEEPMQTVFYCPVDQYGQRTGEVIECSVAPQRRKVLECCGFVYDDYATALYAAQC